MAHSLSARKRIRQSVKHRAVNRARKIELKDTVRSFKEALSSGDKAKSAEALKAAIKKLDKVASKGTIHKNTASRRKSRLQRKFNASGKTA